MPKFAVLVKPKASELILAMGYNLIGRWKPCLNNPKPLQKMLGICSHEAIRMDNVDDRSGVEPGNWKEC